MPHLLDPNFRRTVVLLIHHDANGTFGLVLNRTTDLTAPSLCSSLEIDWRGAPDHAVDWGGPVAPETGWVVFDETFEIQTAEEVKSLGEGVSFARSLEVLRLIAGAPPERLRLLLGYAGWGPGQLETELSQGAWLLAPLRREVVFDIDPESMWEYVVRSLGIEPATLVASRGVH